MMSGRLWQNFTIIIIINKFEYKGQYSVKFYVKYVKIIAYVQSKTYLLERRMNLLKYRGHLKK